MSSVGRRFVLKSGNWNVLNVPFLFFFVFVFLFFVVVCSADNVFRSVIFMDFRFTNMTENSLLAAVSSFFAKIPGDGSTFDFQKPVVVGSNGSVLVAMAELQRLLGSGQLFFDVIFLAETEDVSIAISHALKKDKKTAHITVLSVYSSNEKLCGVSANSRNVCMVPQDIINVGGLFDVVASSLLWDSVALVFSSDAYGSAIESTLNREFFFVRSAPTVVTKVYIKADGSPEDDDYLIMDLFQYRSVGVLCFVTMKEFERLRAAVVRLGKVENFFLIGSRKAVNMLESLSGSVQPFEKMWGSLFVSRFTSVSSIINQGFFDIYNIDNFGAFIVSHLFDGFKAIAVAANTSPAKIRSVCFDGFSGSVAFDASTGQRVGIEYMFLSKTFAVDQPLITWSLNSFADIPVIKNFNPVASKILVLPSPLRAVKVCMAAASGCYDAETLSAMTFVFLQRNQLTQNKTGAAAFIPVLINTGANGVAGLSLLVTVVHSCSAFIGPGRGRLVSTFAPVLNAFSVTQVDFNTAENVFSDRLAYPYLSRTIPANVFNYLIYGEVCAYFGWERVLIIGFNDQFVSSRVESMKKSMIQRNINVEQVYMISTLDKENIVSTMDEIYKRAISRIVIVLLPLYGDMAKMWFGLFDKLSYMKKYIFFLGSELCQYSVFYPEERNKSQSSFCVYPYVPRDRLNNINEAMKKSGLFNTQMEILREGGFGADVDQCNLSTIHNEAAFAIDAAFTVINSVDCAINKSVSLNKSSNLLSYIRSTSLDVFTGIFRIDTNGNRDQASFNIDIQIPNRTFLFGQWTHDGSPSFRYTESEQIKWMTGRTDVPDDTFRDIQFILGRTVSASSGTIVLSVLGFLATIAVFAFCYRHYKLQQMVERSLRDSRVPVTEEELQRLRSSDWHPHEA